MIKNLVVTSVAAALMAGTSIVMADEHVIEAVVTQWKPQTTFAKVGDTLRFKNMSGHDTETVEGMIPEGAKPWKAKLGEEGFTVTVDKEGAYIFKCNPHMTTGMVAAVVVGDARPPANLAAMEAALPNVSVGKNMVNRALKKMKQALEGNAGE